MASWRRAIELSLGGADSAKLRSIAHSRTEPASRVERAPILLAYREDPSFLLGGAGSDRIIRRSSAALGGLWPKAQGLFSTIVRVPVDWLFREYKLSVAYQERVSERTRGDYERIMLLLADWRTKTPRGGPARAKR